MASTLQVGPTTVHLDGAVLWKSGLAVDFDGAPNAYHPPTRANPSTGRPPGLDALANAGRPGNWWGIVTKGNDGKGEPVVQGPGDPYPGFYVSSTSLTDPARHYANPRRYVDAMTVPYVSLPSRSAHGFPRFEAVVGLRLGDLVMVRYATTWVAAIYADVGPEGKIGEGSAALALALELPLSGHDGADVLFAALPGTAARPAWTRHHDDIHNAANTAFMAWGGEQRLSGFFPEFFL